MPWQINGIEVDSVSSWQYRVGQLDARVRIRAGTEAFDELRPYANEAGSVEAVVDSTGVVDHVETDLQESPLRITPPDKLRDPPLIADDWFVRSYNERPTDSGSLQYDAVLSVLRNETRQPFEGDEAERYGRFRYGYFPGDDILVESASSTDWIFGFSFGKITVPESTVSGGERRARTTTLSCTLDRDQTEVLLNTLSTTRAVTKREVPDGDDFYVDNHPDGRNTVDVRTPASGSADAYIRDGAWVVTDWMVQRHTPLRFEARLSLALVDAIPVPGALGGSRYGHFNYGQT